MQDNRYYLIYVDILGFEDLVKEIAKDKGIESRKIRDDFINTLKENVEQLEKKGVIKGKKYGESDDWLLATNNLDDIFKTITDILEHSTKYKGYERIPLEIAIGTAEYDKWAKFYGKNFACEDETINFLKTNIIDYYKTWYKQQYDGHSIKQTFILLTKSVYERLEPLDRKKCRKIRYSIKKKIDDKEIKKAIEFLSIDVDKVQQRGRVSEFLEKIGYKGSKRYNRIDDLYVHPLEYEEIENALTKDRIVFITGTREYGKTYTAVRFLWEYYCKGYEPRWIKGEEEIERVNVRAKLEEIERELRPHHIVYFEDPFGKTKYEGRESLEREIGTIIELIKNIEDVYVIITSREEVFKEFEKESLSTTALKEFEKKLNIKRPSYDYEKRKEILLKWAEALNCKWLRNNYFKRNILKSIYFEEILPTPLSIRNFAIATTNITREDELKEQIKKKSRETEKNFAKEIENMTHDKILFLSFLFISDRFEVDFIKVIYNEMVEELNIKDAWEFDRVLNWFKDDKIDVGRYIKFCHPSYLEALKYLLVKDGCTTRIQKDIISKVLLKLSEKDEVAKKTVAHFVKSNFDKISENVKKELVVKFSEKDEATEHLFRIGSALTVSGSVQWVAMEILKGWRAYSPHRKFKASGIAAGILYIGCALCGERRSPRELANPAKVSKTTIRRVWRAVAEGLDIEITLGYDELWK